jgi:hypothetical protein
MASDYGLNFGFRVSDETVRYSEGRFRTPTTGSPLLIGTAVEIDAANPGYLKASAANAPLIPGVAGLLVQEEQWDLSIFETSYVDSYNLGVAKPGRLSVVTTGAGTKVWFKNTAAVTTRPNRAQPAVTMATVTGLNLRDTVGWDGSKWVKVTDPAAAWMTVTDVKTASGYFEGVLLK